MVDWQLQEEKNILNSLQAIKDFKVSQPRPLITIVIELYKDRKIKLKHAIRIISQLEAFHFIFSAITSSRASGMESLYSKYSRKLSEADKNVNIIDILNELSKQLKDKIESDISYATFEDKFLNLKFSNDLTKDKKVIQYIFKLKEKMMHNTDELTIDSITLEHIHPQQSNTEWSHNIGNLLPLSGKLNRDCDTKDLQQKIPILEKSDLKQVKEFCNEYKNEPEWTEKLTKDRAIKLAKELYDFSMSKFS